LSGRVPPRHEPRFGLILVVIITAYAAVIALGSTPYAGVLRVVLLGVVLLIGVRVPGTRTRAGIGVGLAVGASAVGYLSGLIRLQVVLTSVAAMLLVLASIGAIVRYLLRTTDRNAQHVGGALAVYLLLAMLFAATHQLLAALLGQPYLAGVTDATDTAGYLYFSVITITTVGYGDISPGSDAARAVAMAEALFGQLYLVAVVGAAVSTWARRPPGHEQRH
jgi:hypothetical protein